MKTILEEGNKYILRFDKGEELIKSLTDFCEEEKIESGWFSGLGATSDIVISHYDIDVKRYSDVSITERLEIISLAGNIAMMGGKTIIHTHGSFSDLKMNTRAGHIKKLIVGPTCEVFMEKFDGKIEREYSDEIGLNLLK